MLQLAERVLLRRRVCTRCPPASSRATTPMAGGSSCPARGAPVQPRQVPAGAGDAAHAVRPGHLRARGQLLECQARATGDSPQTVAGSHGLLGRCAPGRRCGWARGAGRRISADAAGALGASAGAAWWCACARGSRAATGAASASWRRAREAAAHGARGGLHLPGGGLLQRDEGAVDSSAERHRGRWGWRRRRPRDAYGLSEQEAFRYREGAFYGTIFDPERAGGHRVGVNGGEVNGKDQVVTGSVYRRMFSCYDAEWDAGLANATHRVCALPSRRAANCAATRDGPLLAALEGRSAGPCAARATAHDGGGRGLRGCGDPEVNGLEGARHRLPQRRVRPMPAGSPDLCARASSERVPRDGAWCRGKDESLYGEELSAGAGAASWVVERVHYQGLSLRCTARGTRARARPRR